MPIGVNYIQETTVFREFGPIAGNTMRFGYQYAPSVGPLLGKQTVDADARYYLRIGETGLLALRGRGFMSFGDFPDFTYFGGNSEMRGYEYLEFIGHDAGFFNAELRFPLIEAMLTPIGVLGGVRGSFFFNLGGASVKGAPFQAFTRSTELLTPTVSFRQLPNGQFEAVPGTPTLISGFRLVDTRAFLRHRAPDDRLRPPPSLRLVVADALQPGVGGQRLRVRGHPGWCLHCFARRERHRWERPVPEAEVRLLDRL